MWYIYSMKYYSAIKKNTFESILMRWMNLEPIIQGELSQRKIKSTKLEMKKERLQQTIQKYKGL